MAAKELVRTWSAKALMGMFISPTRATCADARILQRIQSKAGNNFLSRG
jgi:hypothetical protein